MELRNQWTALGGFLVLIGIIVILATAQFEFIPSIVSSLGVILIASGTIEIGLTQMTSREITESVESAVEEQLSKPLYAFYQDRSERADLRDSVEGAKALWLAWISGSRVTIENISNAAESNANLRLILIHPESQALAEVNEAVESSTSLQGLKEDIRANTQAAIDSGFEVRWLREPLQNSINIINPGHEGAMAEIDIFLPFRSPEDRPTVVVTPDSGSKLFERLKTTYSEQFWANAETPPND